MTKVTNLNDFRKDAEEQGAFLDLLTPEMEKEDFVQPFPKSLFDEVSSIHALAEKNALRRAQEASSNNEFKNPMANLNEDLLEG